MCADEEGYRRPADAPDSEQHPHCPAMQDRGEVAQQDRQEGGEDRAKDCSGTNHQRHGQRAAPAPHHAGQYPDTRQRQHQDKGGLSPWRQAERRYQAGGHIGQPEGRQQTGSGRLTDSLVAEIGSGPGPQRSLQRPVEEHDEATQP